jgi:hypothetical protein
MALWQSQFLGFIKTYPRHHLFPLHHTTRKTYQGHIAVDNVRFSIFVLGRQLHVWEEPLSSHVILVILIVFRVAMAMHDVKVGRARKVKNFVATEKKHLYTNMLCIS